MERSILFSLEAEFATLNHLLTSVDTVSVLNDLGSLRPEYYSDKGNRKIFETIQLVYSERGADPIYLLEHYPDLRDRLQKVMQTTSVLNAERFGNAVDSLEDAYQRRVVEQVSKEMLAISTNRDIRRPYSAAFNALVKHPIGRIGRGSASSIENIADSFLRDGNNALGGPALVSGMERFDRVIRGDLIAMVGGLHSGKTWFASNLCMGYLRNGASGVYYSLDLGKRQIFEKLISLHSEVDYRAILARHTMDSEQERRVTASARSFKDFPFEIHDDKLTLGEIVNSLYHLKSRQDIQFAIIDGGDMLPEDFSRSMAQLRKLSRRLGIPVFFFARGSAANLRDFRAASAVVHLMKDEAPESSMLKLKVIKSDDGPSGGTLSFDWHPRTGLITEQAPAPRATVHAM